MKTRGLLLVGALFFCCSVRHAPAQGTAFIYQGQLTDGGNPAGGIYDLRFALYDSLTNGNVVGSPLTNSATSVSNGLFTTTLDFGTNLFTGADRWLEIAVRTNGGASFVTLSPRQQLNATPYAITAGSLTGPLPAGALSGTYGGAVTLNNPTNSFTGNGAGLTGVPAAGITGLGSMALEGTNAPVFNNGINYGFFTIFTNAAFPFGGLNLDPAADANMFWNETHPGSGEFQITSTGSMSLNSGYNDQHNSTLQLGSSASTYQGFAENINIQYDSASDAAHPLGYSHLFQFITRYYGDNFSQFGSLGLRAESVDTNGHLDLKFYNPTTGGNILYGETPGTEVFAITPYGARVSGNLARKLNRTMATTNYALDFNGPDKLEVMLFANLAVSVTNLNFTNLSLEKDLYLEPGTFSWALTLPANWRWENDSGTAIAPTSISASTVLHIHVTANCSSVATNIYARASLAPYSPVADADATAFYTSAGVTNQTQQAAANQFVLDLKAHGLWAKMDCIYPFLGGNATADSYNLKNAAAYRIAWHGTVTHDANGVTGDGVTGYGDTGFVPATAPSPNYTQNSASMFVYCKSPAPPSTSTLVGSASNVRACILPAGASVFNVGGLNNSDNPGGTVGFPGDFTDTMLVGSRTGPTAEVAYAGSISATGTSTPTTGVPNLSFYVLAEDNLGLWRPTTANLGLVMIGGGLSLTEVFQLETDVANFVGLLGR